MLENTGEAKKKHIKNTMEYNIRIIPFGQWFQACHIIMPYLTDSEVVRSTNHFKTTSSIPAALKLSYPDNTHPLLLHPAS